MAKCNLHACGPWMTIGWLMGFQEHRFFSNRKLVTIQTLYQDLIQMLHIGWLMGFQEHRFFSNRKLVTIQTLYQDLIQMLQFQMQPPSKPLFSISNATCTTFKPSALLCYSMCNLHSVVHSTCSNVDTGNLLHGPVTQSWLSNIQH